MNNCNYIINCVQYCFSRYHPWKPFIKEGKVRRDLGVAAWKTVNCWFPSCGKPAWRRMISGPLLLSGRRMPRSGGRFMSPFDPRRSGIRSLARWARADGPESFCFLVPDVCVCIAMNLSGGTSIRRCFRRNSFGHARWMRGGHGANCRSYRARFAVRRKSLHPFA